MRPELLLCLALVACKGGDLPPPEATTEQIAREQVFLRENFLSDACLVLALERAKPFIGGSSSSPTYSVELPPSALVHDGWNYLVLVRTSDRVATVRKRGGYFGVDELLGPVPLSTCLQPVFGLAR